MNEHDEHEEALEPLADDPVAVFVGGCLALLLLAVLIGFLAVVLPLL